MKVKALFKEVSKKYEDMKRMIEKDMIHKTKNGEI